ncbi:MAG: hypothetical protein Q8L48_28890 [Archangium sp.]|nr:hypothetical protein [Archangium sp.]
MFVGVLMIGIHMAEYAQLSLKVQDAQTFAVWEASGRRVQTREVSGATSTTPFSRTLDNTTGVAPRAAQRFADFNGLGDSSNGDVIIRALTEGSGVQVRCEEDRSLAYLASPTARVVYQEEGGLRCSASAQVKAINIPRRFLQRDSGGFFRESIVRSAPIPVCGMGLPVNGACRGALAILTNDWGLANEETEECKNTCTASPYRGLVESMFEGGGTKGADFAARYAGPPGTTADRYHFSYSGVESGMVDYVGGEGTPNFITGGAGVSGGMVERLSHPKCFLGKNCP